MTETEMITRLFEAAEREDQSVETLSGLSGQELREIALRIGGLSNELNGLRCFLSELATMPDVLVAGAIRDVIKVILDPVKNHQLGDELVAYAKRLRAGAVKAL